MARVRVRRAGQWGGEIAEAADDQPRPGQHREVGDVLEVDEKTALELSAIGLAERVADEDPGE